MSNSKRNILEGLPELNTEGFQPLNRVDKKPLPATEQVRAISEAATFSDREPVRVAAPIPVVVPTNKPQLRRRRTGRNVQFAAKITQETHEAIYRVADSQDWGVGELIEKAVAALEREIAAQNRAV